MSNWRKKFRHIVRNPWLDLFVGAVLAISGFWEAWETLPRDLESSHFGVHHGAILLGVVIAIRAFADMFAGFEFIDEAEIVEKRVEQKKTVN